MRSSHLSYPRFSPLPSFPCPTTIVAKIQPFGRRRLGGKNHQLVHNVVRIPPTDADAHPHNLIRLTLALSRSEIRRAACTSHQVTPAPSTWDVPVIASCCFLALPQVLDSVTCTNSLAATMAAKDADVELKSDVESLSPSPEPEDDAPKKKKSKAKRMRVIKSDVMHRRSREGMLQSVKLRAAMRANELSHSGL